MIDPALAFASTGLPVARGVPLAIGWRVYAGVVIGGVGVLIGSYLILVGKLGSSAREESYEDPIEQATQAAREGIQQAGDDGPTGGTGPDLRGPSGAATGDGPASPDEEDDPGGGRTAEDDERAAEDDTDDVPDPADVGVGDGEFEPEFPGLDDAIPGETGAGDDAPGDDALADRFDHEVTGQRPRGLMVEVSDDDRTTQMLVSEDGIEAASPLSRQRADPWLDDAREYLRGVDLEPGAGDHEGSGGAASEEDGDEDRGSGGAASEEDGDEDGGPGAESTGEAGDGLPTDTADEDGGDATAESADDTEDRADDTEGSADDTGERADATEESSDDIGEWEDVTGESEDGTGDTDDTGESEDGTGDTDDPPGA